MRDVSTFSQSRPPIVFTTSSPGIKVASAEISGKYNDDDGALSVLSDRYGDLYL